MTTRAIATFPTSGQRGLPAAPIRRALLLGALLAGLLYLAFRPAPAQAAVWIEERSFTRLDLATVSCVSTTFCRAGGQNGTIVNYNGTGWNVDQPVPAFIVWDLDCASPTFCKAVRGTEGGLAYDGERWRDESIPFVAGGVGGLHGLTCVSADFCIAVGAKFQGPNVVWTWDRGAWRTNEIGTIPQLAGVSCVSTSFCKAVGAGGTIISYDGTRWRAEPNPSREGLHHVSCATTSFCKAVGNNGTILSYDGGAWRADTSGRRQVLQGVSCPTTSFCKAVGANGTILSWDGRTWHADASGTDEHLTDISCLSATFCKAVGRGGTILSFTREAPVAVTCAGTGQDCDAPMPFSVVLRPSRVLRVRFVASPEGCSDARVTLTVIFRPAQSGFIMLFPIVAASTSPFLAPGGSTEELVLDNLPDRPGEYLLSVTAEGREGGCNTGRLESFGGTLIVTSSE